MRQIFSHVEHCSNKLRFLWDYVNSFTDTLAVFIIKYFNVIIVRREYRFNEMVKQDKRLKDENGFRIRKNNKIRFD